MCWHAEKTVSQMPLQSSLESQCASWNACDVKPYSLPHLLKRCWSTGVKMLIVKMSRCWSMPGLFESGKKGRSLYDQSKGESSVSFLFFLVFTSNARQQQVKIINMVIQGHKVKHPHSSSEFISIHYRSFNITSHECLKLCLGHCQWPACV